MNFIKKVLKRVRSILIFHGFGKYGSNSFLQKPLLIKNKREIYVGDCVLMRTGIRLEVIKDWFGKQYDGKIIIGEGTVIEQYCHFVAANKLEIGSDCLISAHVFISDCSHMFFDINKKVLLQDLDVKETSIGDRTFIGYGVNCTPYTG